jgi:thiol-disulfide isomerase/thioredoxin
MKKLLTAATLFSLVVFGCQGPSQHSAKESKGSSAKVEQSQRESGESSQQEQGVKAYDFTFTDVNGKVHRLSDYKGKVVIVQFFGTYCPPCRAEIPFLNSLYQKYKGKLVVIGLSVDYTGKPPSELKGFVQEMGITYLVGPCPEKAWDEYAGRITGLDSIPQTYFIDKNGFIRAYEVGFTPAYEPAFEKAVKKLINQ